MTRDGLCFLLRVYQRLFSPILSKRLCCRFYPTCSEYAILSIQEYGSIRGIQITLGRLARCRPDNLESCIDFPRRDS